MQAIKWCSPLFLVLALVMMIVSACSQGNTASSLSPLQVLQNSANAMRNLQTSHVALNVTSQISGTNATGLETPGNIDVTLKGSGEQLIPDNQEMMDLILSIDDLPAPVSEVKTSDKVYIQTPDSQWYSFDKSIFEQEDCSLANFFSPPTIDLSSLLTLIQHINITDDGHENWQGQSLRHMTANIDKTALKQLLSDNPGLKCEVGSQDLDTVTNFSSSVDIYIDETQFYVHHGELRINLGTNDNGQTTSNSTDFIIDLSNFNQPVTITEPANAIPLTDPKQLLGPLSGLLK